MKSLFAIQLFSPNPRSSKKIYGSVWNQASLEYRRYYFLWMRNFINISWISKRGKSVGFSHSTHVYLIPSNIGFDFILRPQKKVSLFYGFGVGACYEHFKDKSPYVKEISTLWSGSFLGRAGATFYLYDEGNLELFASYSYNLSSRPKVSSPLISHYPDTGGIQLGGSINFKI
jgi:hypothetical protein